MLNRIGFALAYALTFFVAGTGVANAASDRTEVGVGVFIVVVISMTVLTVLYAIKWYFGAAEPPVIPPGGTAPARRMTGLTGVPSGPAFAGVMSAVR